MRNNKPERLGGLEVDHKIKLGWLLDRNVGGLRLDHNRRNWSW